MVGMEKTIDRSCILALCVCLSLLGKATDTVSVACLVVSVGVTFACELTQQRLRLAAERTLVVLGVVLTLVPKGMYSLPLVVFELTRIGNQATRPPWILALVAATLVGRADTPTLVAAVLVTASFAFLLAERQRRLGAITGRLHEVEDRLSDTIIDLQARNHALADAREAEPHAATLAERTRLARQVHDGVGHKLTRLIYQVAACKVVHGNDEAILQELTEMQAGLDDALDTLRASVHALEDAGMDLSCELNGLVASSSVRDAQVDCALDHEPTPAEARCLVAVAREAVTNAERHAQATWMLLRVSEFPALWQLVITNDGVPTDIQGDIPTLFERGMGLRSMEERVKALDGTLRVSSGKGRFRIFASIPRGASAA